MKKLHCCKFPYSCIFTDNDRFVNDKVEFKERVKKSIRECKQVVLEKSDDNDPHAIESVILHSLNFYSSLSPSLLHPFLSSLPPHSPTLLSLPLLPLFSPLIPLPPSLYSIGQWHHDVMKSARELIFEPEV